METIKFMMLILDCNESDSVRRNPGLRSTLPKMILVQELNKGKFPLMTKSFANVQTVWKPTLVDYKYFNYYINK